MNDFNQKRADRDADLYRFDGRFYDLNQENGVLILQLRHSVRWERSIISVLAALVIVALPVAFDWSFKIQWPNTYFSWGGEFIFGMSLTIASGLAGGLVIGMKENETWRFDKDAAKVHCNTLEVAAICTIRGVRAWRRGAKFYLSLELPQGKSLTLSRFFGFSRSERAWRQDAAHIAQFLEVPLQIPPVIPA